MRSLKRYEIGPVETGQKQYGGLAGDTEALPALGKLDDSEGSYYYPSQAMTVPNELPAGANMVPDTHLVPGAASDETIQPAKFAAGGRVSGVDMEKRVLPRLEIPIKKAHPQGREISFLETETIWGQRRLVWQSYEAISESNIRKLHLERLISEQQIAREELVELNELVRRARSRVIRANADAVLAALLLQGVSRTLKSRSGGSTELCEIERAVGDVEKTVKEREKALQRLETQTEDTLVKIHALESHISEVSAHSLSRNLSISPTESHQSQFDADDAFGMLLHSGPVDLVVIRLKQSLVHLHNELRRRRHSS